MPGSELQGDLVPERTVREIGAGGRSQIQQRNPTHTASARGLGQRQPRYTTSRVRASEIM